jgi:uncharacterized protein (TIGR02145 family)
MKRNLFFIIAIVAVISLFTTCASYKKDKLTSETATVKDIDGNVYHTVTIGTQVWMVENLKTSKYNDGTVIPNVTDNRAWEALTTGAWCNYKNDKSTGTKYGKLYNWYAVNTGKLAPVGWHVPSDEEWQTLNNYVSNNLGTSGSVAKALAATTHWISTNDIGAIGNDLTKNNSTGFTALPGGCRFGSGSFSDIDYEGSWWSSTQGGTYGTWYSVMNHNDSDLGSHYSYKDYGLSVRCVKD